MIGKPESKTRDAVFGLLTLGLLIAIAPRVTPRPDTPTTVMKPRRSRSIMNVIVDMCFMTSQCILFGAIVLTAVLGIVQGRQYDGSPVVWAMALLGGVIGVIGYGLSGIRR